MGNFFVFVVFLIIFEHLDNIQNITKKCQNRIKLRNNLSKILCKVVIFHISPKMGCIFNEICQFFQFTPFWSTFSSFFSTSEVEVWSKVKLKYTSKKEVSVSVLKMLLQISEITFMEDMGTFLPPWIICILL